METRKPSRKPQARVNTGDAVLRNAQALNMKSVKTCFDAFAELHRSYCKAQGRVDAAEEALAAEQTRLTTLDADQDDAVEALALCLANDGESRTNPFAGFSDQGPGTIKVLPPGEEAKAIHTLVAAVQRGKGLSQATLRAARTAEQAAHAVEAALAPLEMRRTELRMARGFRNTIAQSWDVHLSALRLAARGAAATTVPGLYTALFGRPARAAKKTKDTPATPPETPPAPAVTPVVATPPSPAVSPVA